MKRSIYRLTLFFWLVALRTLAADSVVVFNEVMYHPRDEDGVEWIELFNQMAVDVELTGWSISGAAYSFPTNSILPGRQYLIVASNPSALRARTGITNVLGPLGSKLSNSGERLRLINHNGRIMDEMKFQTAGSWPAGPDGSGFTLSKKTPDMASAPPENWIHSAQPGGTPGTSNFPAVRGAPAILLNELSPITNTSFSLEMIDRSGTGSDISGFEVEFSRGSAFVLPPGTTIAPGGFYLFYPTGYVPSVGEKVFLYTAGRDQLLDAVEIPADGLGRREGENSGWGVPLEITPGQSNRFASRHEVVINEIFYSRPRGETNSGWIELLNREASAVDIGGWRLSGVDYTAPAGTTLGPGEYAVIAQDAVSFQQRYPGVHVLGSFDGRLSGSSDRLFLQDQLGNPVDDVPYFDSEPWPANANTEGVSLELRDPRADNSRPEAWAASKRPGEWQSYTHTATASSDGGPTRWNEFIFGLLEAGEVLLDDFSVIESSGASGRELLQNGTFENSSASWRFLGTHRQADVMADPDQPTNHVLHLVADGPTEHMHNHVETTLANNQPIRNGVAYKISWRARWLAGSNKLNTRLYFNRVARTTALTRPAVVATPGAPNSVAVTNIGPTFSDLQHFPAVPKPGEPTQVRTRCSDPDGVQRCKLWTSSDGTTWNAQEMILTNGEYEVTMAGKSAGSIVQFYVEAQDQLGAVSFYPAAGRASRALYKVNDSQALSSRLHNFRLIMLPAEAALLHSSTNVMSNGKSLCTVIYDESEIFYDCRVHLQSSERGRSDSSRVGFTVSFPATRLFRGVHDTITFDRSGGWSGRGGRQDEIVMRHIINQAGDSPDMYNDLVRLLAPLATHTGTAMLLSAKYGKEFFDGSTYAKDGSLFKLELIYYPTSSVSGDPQKPKLPQPDEVIGADLANRGNNPEDYRWFFTAENGAATEDYGPLINLAKAFSLSGTNFQQRATELIDVEQWTRTFAFKSLSGDADTYGFGLPHNQLFYLPPDARALALPWDMDFAWARAATESINVSGSVGRLIHGYAAFQRLYLGNLRDILDSSYNTDYLARWTTHYGSLAGQNYGGILSYVGTRAKAARSQLPALSPFAITTFSGSFFQTNTGSMVLRGTAPYTIKRVIVNNIEQGEGLTWPAVQNWETSLALAYGSNVVSLVGYDFHNRAVTTNQVIIYSTAGLPDRDRDGMPDEWETRMGLNPGQADGTLDSDGDGLNNLSEYLAGTAPMDATSTLRLDLNWTGPQQFSLSFVARNAHAYRIEYRTTLSDRWTTLTTIPPEAIDHPVNQPQTVSGLPIGLFYRVLLAR